MPMTIADIAKEAGVSRATVSGVLNDNPAVAAKTRERVLEIINKHGFRPNEVARALALQQTGLIGLIVKDISNPLYTKIALGVEQICDQHGYSVIMGNTHTEIEREVEYTSLLKRRRVDGLIIFPLQKEADFVHIRELLAANLPFVLLADLPGINADLVRSDDETGAFVATTHLLQQGCRRLAYISGPKDFLASDRRLHGFQKALLENGLVFDDSMVFRAGWRLADGYAASINLLARLDQPPDGFLCYNDAIAMGLLRALRENGKSVPGDAAVIGFDDDDVAAYFSPSLTTVAQPATEIGRRAAQRLFERLNFKGEVWTPENLFLKTELLVRESTMVSNKT